MEPLPRIATVSFLIIAFALSRPTNAQSSLQESAPIEPQQTQVATLPLATQEVMEVVLAKSKPVVGKPYSADSETEVVQTLADGNRIVRHTSGKFYRDSTGRTRREQTFANVSSSIPGETKIFLENPSTHSLWVMDPGEKTTQRLTNFAYRKAERVDAESRPTGPVSLPKLEENRDIVVTDLGQKTIEGVPCQGKRDTITIPTGQIGNELPIVIVTETWFSPAIEAVVQSTTNDPRFGQTTYQLHGIKLGEPDHQLFDPPTNFRVEGSK